MSEEARKGPDGPDSDPVEGGRRVATSSVVFLASHWELGPCVYLC